MLKKAEIQVANYDKLDITYTGTVWGFIQLKIDEEYFPGENWDDLLLAALHSWYDDFRDLQSGIIESAHFQFFDGPYSFIIKRVKKKWEIVLYESSIEEEDKIKSVYEIDFDYLYRSYFQSLDGIMMHLERINKKVLDYTRLLNRINLYKPDDKLKRIDVKTERFEIDEDGQIFSSIFLNIEDVLYPRGYNMVNISVLLDDWFDQFLNFQSIDNISEYLPCNDENFFELQKYGASCKIILYRTRAEECLIKINEYNIDMDYFCESYFNCVKDFLFKIKKMNYTDENCESLKKKYNRYSSKYLFL